MTSTSTLNGKNACNRVGDTIKRLAAHGSLQRPFSNQILAPKQLFDFADDVISVFVSSVEIFSNTRFLESWFIPNSSGLSLTINKTYSTHSEKVSLTEHGSSKVQTMIEDIKSGKFYVSQYDNNWYFCVANYVWSEHGDVNMKFLHPKGPSEKFFWSQCDNECWIPIEDVYCEVAAPWTSNTGQFYCFQKNNRKYWKLFQLRTAHLLFIIILVHIFSLVYSYFFYS